MVVVINGTNGIVAPGLTSEDSTGTATLTTTTLVLGGTTITATGTELNYVDGVTSAIQTQLNAKVESLTDLSITASTAELNTLDGITASTAELNYNDITTLGTSQASKVVTADANGDVTLSEELKAKSYNETYVALSGTTPTVNCESGNLFALTTSGNTTFTFSNPPSSGTAYGFTLKLTSGGSHTITYPASVDWAGATAPDAPASGETDVLVFITHDGGTTWYGAISIDAAG